MMRSEKSLLQLVLFVLGLSVVSIASGQEGTLVDKPADDVVKLKVPDRLTVATREVPPFAMRNEDGQWIGISIDLLREVNAELESESGHEVEIDFKVMSLAEMLDAVENSTVDLAAAAITVNYEREKRMDFTHSFHTSGLGIAVGAKQRQSGWSGIVDAVLSKTLAITRHRLSIYFVISRHC